MREKLESTSRALAIAIQNAPTPADASRLIGELHTLLLPFFRLTVRKIGWLPYEDGENFIQDMYFVLVKEILPHYDPSRSFVAWVNWVTTRRLFNFADSNALLGKGFRKFYKRGGKLASIDAQRCEDFEGSTLGNLLTAPQDDSMERTEAARAVLKHLEGVWVSPLERQAATLVLCQDMSYLEAAELLGRDVKSIDNALRRFKVKAAQRLRSHYEDYLAATID